MRREPAAPQDAVDDDHGVRNQSMTATTFFTDEERISFLATEPAAADFLHPYVGSVEYINSESRWILALHNATPAQIRAMPRVLDRINASSCIPGAKQRARQRENTCHNTDSVSRKRYPYRIVSRRTQGKF